MTTFAKTLCYLFLTSMLQKKKMKYIRSNNCKFLTKELRKTIMDKSKLRNLVLKTRNKESKRQFMCQRNSVLACSAKLKDIFLGN